MLHDKAKTQSKTNLPFVIKYIFKLTWLRPEATEKSDQTCPSIFDTILTGITISLETSGVKNTLPLPVPLNHVQLLRVPSGTPHPSRQNHKLSPFHEP